jgi:hypothetical protein
MGHKALLDAITLKILEQTTQHNTLQIMSQAYARSPTCSKWRIVYDEVLSVSCVTSIGNNDTAITRSLTMHLTIPIVLLTYLISYNT